MGNRTVKILAIDDNRDNLTIIEALIMEAFPGAVVLSALKGQNGLDIAAKEEPDVILLDIIMPGMDGYEVCQKLKADKKLCDIPVVFITAIKGNRESRIKALESGAEAFLTKPIDEIELTAQIRAMIKIRTANIEKRNENKRLAVLVEEKTRELEKSQKKTIHLMEAIHAENNVRKKSEDALLEAQKLAHIGSFEYDMSSNKLTCTDEGLKICGIKREHFDNSSDAIFQCVHPDDRGHVVEMNTRAITEKKVMHYECRMISPEGFERIASISVRPLLDVAGDCVGTTGIVQDITERIQIEKHLKESEERYKYLFEHSGVGIGYYTADGVVISYNKKALENIGGRAEDYIGKSFRDLFPKEQAEIYYTRLTKAISSDQPQEYEDYLILNSRPRWFSSTFTRVLNIMGEVLGVQIASLDISERKKAEEELIFLSYHDQLTGLCNRRYFEKEINNLDKRENLPISVIMGDVNGLKLINDSFGHDTGDAFLKKAADTIKRACRTDDMIARLGGDEFAIILLKTDFREAQRIVDSIKNLAVNEKIANIELSISLGYDTKNQEGQSIGEILSNTENDMYRHKICERSSMRSKTVDIIMNTLFEKSNREMLHSQRVSVISEAIAAKMHYNKDEIGQIRIAGLVHDIGKIGIDEKTLNKNGKPDDTEWKELKKHPEMGWRILGSTTEFSELSDIVIAHHEKWDGSGYPKGLKEQKIPLQARIITVADAYDAMTSERSYRKPLSKDAAVEELKRCAGTQFDPKIVDVFLNLVLPYNSDFGGGGKLHSL